MATSKPKKTASKSKSTKTKTVKSAAVAKKKVGKETKVNTEAVVKVEKCSFFAKKCDANENILTIFHDKKIWGALLGEALGTMILCMVLLTLGVYQPLYIFFVMLGVTMVTFGLSGANLNPIITAGMMATRRMSAIRGVLYILAQVFGAWIGYLIISAFVNEGGLSASLPEMAAVEDDAFWIVTLVEFLGSTIIAFFFARALQYKRSALTFAALVAAGTTAALIVVIVLSSTYLSLSSNFMMNPAIALMYQILPSAGDNFGELMASIGLALATYVAFPIIGGIIGFYISDLASYLKGENVNM